MRLFFDTNVLLDVALRRDPHLEKSQEILLDAIANHECYISWHTISNLAYIIGRLETPDDALVFIKEVTKVCTIAPVCHDDFDLALGHNSGDLEDAMQIASAMAVQADTIITRDPVGFSKSPIPITNPSAA